MQTTTHKRAVGGQTARFADLQAPLLGYLSQGICLPSPSISLCFTSPLSLQTIQSLFKSPVFKQMVIYSIVCDCVCMQQCSQRQLLIACLHILSGCVFLAKTNYTVNHRLTLVSLRGLDYLLLIVWSKKCETSQYIC